MPAEVEPPELAELLDFAERARIEDWSLRSAITRYAQPQPIRASAVLELVRRIEFGLKPHMKLVERDGPALWTALQDGDPGTIDEQLIGLLRAMVDFDRLGDVLAAWAVDRKGERPDAEVDAVASRVDRDLNAAGVGREERVDPQQRRRAPRR